MTVAMPSDCIQRRIKRFLDQYKDAADRQDWPAIAGAARAALAIDQIHEDAQAFLKMAGANGVSVEAASLLVPETARATSTPSAPAPEPTSFAKE